MDSEATRTAHHDPARRQWPDDRHATSRGNVRAPGSIVPAEVAVSTEIVGRASIARAAPERRHDGESNDVIAAMAPATVEPVVRTSSISTRWPSSIDRGRSGRARNATGFLACCGAPARRRHTTGPDSTSTISTSLCRAIIRAIARAGSMPWRIRRDKARGTGTSTVASGRI